MDFRLLGPLEVLDGDVPLPIAAGKQGALLAILLLRANRAVSRDQIVDDLWGEEVPGSARKMVQIYVSRLRKTLPEPRLQTRQPGYLLEVRNHELDLDRFELLVARGKTALADGNADDAAGALADALQLWRGPALAEFSEPFAHHESVRLEELRLAALELRLDADLARGRDGELVAELETLIARHPLRERLRGQHMLALYRSGRHADALASFRAFSRTLDDELGIEPSPALRELERQILRQDRAIEGAQRPTPTTARAPDAQSSARAAPTAAVGQIAYARSGDVRVAYQVVSDGPIDLVLVHGWVCTFQPGWENPNIAAFYRRLASMGRLILFDKRGTGLSDRVSTERLPDLETRMDDVRAVLDAVGSTRAVVLGVSEGGSMSALFAATHPERIHALVLMGTFARVMQSADYPLGISSEENRRRLSALDADEWVAQATSEWLGRVGPAVLDDPTTVRWYESYVARGASPSATRAIRLMNAEIDIRDVLPTIGVPTLVLYRSREYYRDATRLMGAAIPGARVVELPGDDHLPWEGDSDALLGEIERFLSGVHEEVAPDRVLATVLFTDIVGSTSQAVELGDARWRELLGRHDRLVRAQIARFRGRAVKSTGDGVLATFDGPARAVRCASALVEAMPSLGMEIRAGIHTGEIEQVDDEVGGIAVHIGARIAAAAQPGEVLVSSTVKDIVAGSGLAFQDRGERELAGVPGAWRVFAAETGARE